MTVPRIPLTVPKQLKSEGKNDRQITDALLVGAYAPPEGVKDVILCQR